MSQPPHWGTHPAGQPFGLEWVASPPASPQSWLPVPRQHPYTGPPSYPIPPRWGFPQLSWRRLTWVPGTAAAPARPAHRVDALARSLLPALWLTAGVALLAGAAEAWRYDLLLRSRGEALAAEVVVASDALVYTASVLAVVAAVVSGVFAVLWMSRAREVAAEDTGVRPARPGWQVLAGVLVPGLNLVLAGSLLAELEHAAMRLPAQQRPRPSRMLWWWWAAWTSNTLLCVFTALWSLRDGVQAMADGVVLHALVDLCAVAVAVLTALVVRRLTRLLTPVNPGRVRRLLVVGVSGAPGPPLRPVRIPTSAR